MENAVQKKKSWFDFSHRGFVVLSLLAPLCLWGMFYIWPIIWGLCLSFTKYNLLRPPRFIKLGNFLVLLEDPVFRKSLKVTMFFVAYAVPVNIVSTLLIALGLHAIVRLKTTFRSLYFASAVVPLGTVALLWIFIYHYPTGILNQILGLVGVPAQKWITSYSSALPSLVIMVLWADIGYNVVLFMAGLENIPYQFHEAARIDGASSWQLFWHITMPLLRPMFLFVIVMTTISYFQVFAPIHIMTNGGPLYATTVLPLYIFKNGFMFFKMGYASALSVVLFGFIFILTLIYLRIFKLKWTY